jgi:hypothetical protein
MQQYKISRAFDTRNCFNCKKTIRKGKGKEKKEERKRKMEIRESLFHAEEDRSRGFRSH